MTQPAIMAGRDMASDLFTLKPETQSVRPKDHVGQFLRSGEPVSDQDGGRTVPEITKPHMGFGRY